MHFLLVAFVNRHAKRVNNCHSIRKNSQLRQSYELQDNGTKIQKIHASITLAIPSVIASIPIHALVLPHRCSDRLYQGKEEDILLLFQNRDLSLKQTYPVLT